MLQPIKFANAVTVICVICQIIYIAVVALAPELLYLYLGSMAPGFDLSSIESEEGINLGFAFPGLILMAISVWILTYAVIWLYNRWAK